MPDACKGIPEVYDIACSSLSDDKQDFFEWILDKPDQLHPGQICMAVVWYEKKKKWYLEEVDYDPIQEERSTWKAIEFTSPYPPQIQHNVAKYFDLELEEKLITTNSKIRPVILLKYFLSDWLNPANTRYHVSRWLCLPIFTYKDRHNQEYVLKDQRLNSPDRFYIPTFSGSKPGTDRESVARYHAIQMINESYLSLCRLHCTAREPKMNRPFKLSRFGLKIVMYHFFKYLGIFRELEETETEYTLFKECVNDLIDQAK